MNLIIDIGNTLQKIAVFNNDELAYCQSFSCIAEKNLSTICNQFSINNSIISSVADLDEQVIIFLEKNTKMIHYSHQTKLPISVLYKNIETLGLDRIANAVGAAAAYPNKNVLSIQVGTCLVFDFVNENREYLGGSISPGMNMRFEVLQEKTKKLPLLRKPEEPPFFLGIETLFSIHSGVINGMCFEIDGFIDMYQSNFEDVIVLITGGDANYLQKLIKNTIFAAPNLVLHGLNEIIRYNV